MVGTAQWMAPEVIREGHFDRFSDIWSIGCLVIEMLQGTPPWSEWQNTYAALFKIANSGEPPKFPEDISLEAQNFLSLCLEIDPQKRPNVKALLFHPFITNENIGGPLQSEFYGVGMISDNFRNFYDRFVDEEESEHPKSMSTKNIPVKHNDLEISHLFLSEHDMDAVSDNANTGLLKKVSQFYPKNQLKSQLSLTSKYYYCLFL